SPPLAGSKNGQPASRCSSNMMSPAISGGNANRIIAPTTRVYHAYRGIRLMRMPGGRVLSTPTISSTAAAIEATSMKLRPSSQTSAPSPSVYWVDSGGYMTQPSLGAASKNTEPHTNMPPIRKHQNPNADSRGNGRSRAPSTEGSTRIENASKIGTANRNIITEPCSVNSWL